MSPRRLLIENIVSLTALQALNYVAPLITLPYLVRVLGPSHFGLLSFAQGIVLYFSFFTAFGFNLSQTRAIAACRQQPESVSRIFWSTIFAKVLLMCISAVALALLVLVTPKLRETPELFTVNFLYVIGSTLFPVWLFQGLERLKTAAVLFGAARLVTIPSLILFVRRPEDYVIAGAIQASVEVMASILAWPLILRSFGITWYAPSILEVVDTLKRAWPLFLSASAFQLCSSSATVILGFMAGQIEVGYFSAADKLIKASIAALSPLGQALFPHITAAKLTSSASALQLIRKSLIVVGFLSLVVSVVTALWAGPICQIILGKSFGHSITVVRCLSPLPALFGLTSVLGTQTMLVFEMDRLFSKIMLSSLVFALPVTVASSAVFGAIGTAAASVTTAAFMVVAMLFGLHAKGMRIWKRPELQRPPLADISCAGVE